MKKLYITLIITGFLFIILMSMTSKKEKFYYAFDEKVSLVPKANTLLVKYAESTARIDAEKLINRLSLGFSTKWHNSLTAEIIVKSQKEKEELLSELSQNDLVQTCHPFYTLENGIDMGVTDEILIRFLSEVTDVQKQELQKKFDTRIIKTTKIYQKLKVKKGEDALEIANKYYETGLVEFATPNFLSYPELHQIIPNDTYFNMQVAYHNTGQAFNDGHMGINDADIDAPEAWELTTGSGDIVIAVLDQGVTSNHPDLPNTRQVRLNGSNFGDGDANDPSPTGNANHGNACAGVIAATMNNNQGVAGIAPNCKIMPVRIFNTDGSGVSPDLTADAIEFAVNNGANILSNSWGYQSSSQNLHPVIVAAINYALSNDRVVVFSAGNTANHQDSDIGYVQFPANVNIAGVVTVGASDRNDDQANYSPNSNLIDVVAPSHRAYSCQITGETFEMWTIDIPGNAGYNSWHESGNCLNPPQLGEQLPNNGTNFQSYTGRFGGTSHSCPVVAGIAALLLSVDPSLSYLDVFNILINTAEDVGEYTYTNGRCNEMGHGRVNAHCAVQSAMAELSFISGPSLICSSGASFSISNLPPVDSITWEPGPNLSLTSGQNTSTGVFSATGSGSSWIDVTLHTNCGDIILPQKNVYAGTPNPQDIDFVNVGPYYPGSMVLCEDIPNDGIVQWDAAGSILEYAWSVYDDGSNSWQVNQHPMDPFAEIPMENVQIIKPYGSVNGWVNVKVKARNACGWGNYSAPAFQFSTTTCNSYLLSLTPNPSTVETTISLETIATDAKSTKALQEWDLEVYNQGQQLKARKQKIKGSQATLNTSGWKEGVYIIRAKVNGEVLTEKLVVKEQ